MRESDNQSRKSQSLDNKPLVLPPLLLIKTFIYSCLAIYWTELHINPLIVPFYVSLTVMDCKSLKVNKLGKWESLQEEFQEEELNSLIWHPLLLFQLWPLRAAYLSASISGHIHHFKMWVIFPLVESSILQGQLCTHKGNYHSSFCSYNAEVMVLLYFCGIYKKSCMWLSKLPVALSG